MLHSFGDARAWLRFLPSLAVFALLGFIAYVGNKNDWRWTSERAADEKKTAARDPSDEQAEDGDFGPSRFDPTLTVSHDAEKCRYLKSEPLAFKDEEAVRRAGIHTAEVGQHRLKANLSVTASVDFDPTLVARVSPRASGIIWKIEKKPGDEAETGEVLAIVDSAEVGKAKAAFFQAKVQLDLKRQLRSRLQPGVTPESTILVADAAIREASVQLQTAYQALLNLGFKFSLAAAEQDSDEKLVRWLQFLGLEKERLNERLPREQTDNLLAVSNPLSHKATILTRDGVTGESVAAGQPIYVVGDTSRMMLQLDIRQEEVHRIRPGMPVLFYPDDTRDRSAEAARPIECTIDWVGQEVDPKTRIVKARAYVDNKGGRLKARAFGRADILLHAAATQVAVPEDAVQWEGCSHIVFVKEGPTEKGGPVQFEVRRVTLGDRDRGLIEVESGLKAGERVAVVGSHTLKSMLFKDKLGGGEE